MTIANRNDEPAVRDDEPDGNLSGFMPDSVKLTMIGLLLLVACLVSFIVIVVRVGGIPITEPIGIALALLVFYGLCRGNRLAYLWGRRIGVAGAVLNLVVAVGHIVANSTEA